MKNSKKPINPINNPNGPYHSSYFKDRDGYLTGLTKREYFTAMALQGLLANPEALYTNSSWAGQSDVIAAEALSVADSTLKMLEKYKDDFNV